jgi:hypothetical protein
VRNPSPLAAEPTDSSSGRPARPADLGIHKSLVWVLALGCALRLVPALRRPLETDEDTSLFVASLSWHDMLAYLHFRDAHPPLFFGLLHIALGMGWPVWLLRLVMVACAVASLFFLFQIVRLWSTPQAGGLAAAVAAGMPSLVYYDTWIRMYAPFYALVLLQLWLFSLLLVHADLSRGTRRALWIGWTLAGLAAMYTLYLGGFFIAAQLLYAALIRRDALGKSLAGVAVCAAAFAPQLPAVAAQNAGGGGNNLASFASHKLSTLLLLPGQATLAPQLEGWVAVLAACLAWLWLLVTLAPTLRAGPRSLLPWLAVAPLLLVGFCFVTHHVIFLDRYYLILAYALGAWTGVSLMSAAQHAFAARRRAGAGLLALLIPWASLFSLDPAFYTADWPGVISDIRTRAQPGDLLLLESGIAEWAVLKPRDLREHPVFMVWSAGNREQAWRVARRYRRIWFIAHQPRGVDPDLWLLRRIEGSYRLAYFHLHPRMLPAESVSVGLFVRSGGG